jgi:hypothetical protein
VDSDPELSRFLFQRLLSKRHSIAETVLVDYLTQLKIAGLHFGIDTCGPADRWIRCDAFRATANAVVIIDLRTYSFSSQHALFKTRSLRWRRCG